MSEQRDGFELNGRFYPWMKSMRVVDPVLVVEVTGMKYTEFIEAWGEALEQMEHADGDEVSLDPIVLNGLLAVSFWQQHPDWSRQKVVRFFERLDSDELELVGSDGDDVGPPSPSGSDDEQPENSSLSPTTSNGTQGSLSEPASPVSTGTPTSGIGSAG